MSGPSATGATLTGPIPVLRALIAALDRARHLEEPMRLTKLSIAAVALGVALQAAAAPAQAADAIPFKIGISAPVVTIFPVWMGEAGGFYEKEGLKVEDGNMEGGTRRPQGPLSGTIQAIPRG